MSPKDAIGIDGCWPRLVWKVDVESSERLERAEPLLCCYSLQTLLKDCCARMFEEKNRTGCQDFSSARVTDMLDLRLRAFRLLPTEQGLKIR